jgi:hypothetical protein
MLKSLTTDIDTFNVLKERYQEWEHLGHPHCDPELIDALIALNKLPGVATVWCCSGHEDPDGGERHFQLIFAVTEEGLNKVIEIYNQMTDRVFDLLPEIFLQLNTGYLYTPATNGTYRYWEIEARPTDVIQQCRLLKALARALQ